MRRITTVDARSDEGVEDRSHPQRLRAADEHGERHESVDARMIAVGDQRRAVEPMAGPGTHQPGDLVAGESDRSSERQGRAGGRASMDGSIAGRLVHGHRSRDEDGRHHSETGEALGAPIAQRERDAERDRGQCVPAVVDQVGQQRQAAAERDTTACAAAVMPRSQARA